MTKMTPRQIDERVEKMLADTLTKLKSEGYLISELSTKDFDALRASFKTQIESMVEISEKLEIGELQVKDMTEADKERYVEEQIAAFLMQLKAAGGDIQSMTAKGIDDIRKAMRVYIDRFIEYAKQVEEDCDD